MTKKKRKVRRSRSAGQIALCMIVKNEEENLERCLKSVRGLVSEINIVDTGSVDDTIRIAKNLGARVRRERWTNDFSRPRNISIQMARADWILVLDADEVLSPDAGSMIKAAIKDLGVQGYLLPTRNYTNDSGVANFVANDGTFELAPGCKGWVESRKVRLFRKLPGVRFEGELHEVVGASIRRAGGRTEYLNAIVHHFGYLVSQDSLKKKTEAMLSIAEAKCAHRSDDYKAHYELGVILANLGNLEKAEESFRKSIGLRSDFALAHYDLGVVLSRIGREEEALAQYETALKFEPSNVNTLSNLADSLQRLRRFEEAERTYRLLIDKHPSAKMAWNNLGALLASTGRPKEAKQAFNNALHIDPQYSNASHNLQRLQMLKTEEFTANISFERAPNRPGSISLCMIVRNEEKNLPKSLEHAARSVDEIIVVDTGSSDNSRAIAGELGGAVYKCKWTNDFAAARNYSLSKAGCEWIFILDADEALSVEDFSTIRDLTEDTQALGFSFETRNYTCDSSLEGWRPVEKADAMAGSFPGWFPSEKVRLFRNTPRINFEGTIHELVEPAINRAGGLIEKARIPIHHYGYDRVSKKVEVYLEPAMQKVRAYPDSAQAHFELGAVFHRMKRFEVACESLEKAVKLSPEQVEYLVALGDTLRSAGTFDKAREVYQKAVDLRPNTSNAHRGLGIVLFNQGNIEASRRAFEKALLLNPHDAQSLTNTGVINSRLGNTGEAIAYFKRALRVNPQNMTAWNNLRTLSPRSYTPPMLGLLMIVRDEQSNLTEMLPELASCFNELVIVDTGSHDNTVEVAKKYTDKVFTFSWTDDFSAARNFALSKAESDWILWLDADDRVKPQDVAAMRERISNKKEGFYIKVISKADDSGAAEFLQLRLFPNIDGMEWEGRVHEQLIPSLERLGLVSEAIPEIEIVHQGYDDPDLLEKKTRRNLGLLEKERALRPDDPNVLHHLAQTHCLMGNIREAVEVTEALIGTRDTRQPDDFLLYAMNRLVQYNLLDNNVTTAEEWADRIITAEPGDRLVRYFLGEICYRKGMLHEAINWLEQFCAGKRVPGRIAIPWQALEANAHNYLGLSYRRINQSEKACTEFRKAIEQGARLEARKNLANIYLNEGKLAEAESVLRDAIEAKEEDAEVLTNLGVALARSYRFPEAREILESAVARDPNLTYAHYNLGLVLEKMGQPDEAKKRYSMLSDLDPENVNALAKLGYLEARKGQLETARDFLERALELEPTNQYARNNLEYVQRRLRDPIASSCELSLNMIVKDEEKNIKEILPPIADLFDEIVIVDTGSRDNTVKVAETLGARVVHHPWNDDFAEARNVALRNSAGSWIFWLDADDRIESDAVGVLRKFIARDIPSGVLFPLESVLGNNGSVVQNYSLRFFPNKPGVEWVGIVHEQIADSLRALDIELVNSPDLTIRHIGYEDTGEAWKKNLRNMKLLAKEIAARPEDPYVLFALAQAFLFWGQKEQGAKWLRLLWELREKADDSRSEDLFWMAAVMLSDCAATCGDATEVEMWLENAIGLSPDNWLPYFLLGERKFLKGEHEHAAILIGKAAELGIIPTILPVDLEATRARLEQYLQALELTTMSHSAA